MIVRQRAAKTQLLCQVCICPAAASSVPQTCQVQLTDSRARPKPAAFGGWQQRWLSSHGRHKMHPWKVARGGYGGLLVQR